MEKQNTRAIWRWGYLIIGMICLLFAGIVYAWSILKAPLAAEFGWLPADLALNFTLTMCFFCFGGMAGGAISKRIGCRFALILAAIFACGGFILTSALSGDKVLTLYLTYGVMGGLGIGIAYNVIISTVSAWFPDKKGVCSGCLMMAFGASALVLGKIVSAFIESPAFGWRTAFMLLGISLGVVLLAASFTIRLPKADESKKSVPRSTCDDTDAVAPEYTPGQMIRRSSFWRAFVCIIFMASLGNSVISFARDLVLSIGASAALATTMVGVLSVCNGLGRIITGTLFDKLGRRKTMLLASTVTIAAAGVVLISIILHSLPIFIVGLCLTGLSYGACPSITSTFTMDFYGLRHFPINFSIINFNLMGASFMATISSLLLTSTASYIAPISLLLALSVAALFLNISIRRP